MPKHALFTEGSAGGKHALVTEGPAGGQHKFFVIFSDNFNRPDQPLAAPWVVRAAGSQPITSGAVSAAVVSNRARVTGNAGGASSGIYTAAFIEAGTPDVDVTVTWAVVNSPFTGNGVLLRGDAIDVGSYYFARPTELDYISPGHGSSTVVSYSQVFAAGDVMRITMKGREFRIYRNGTLVASRGAADPDTLPNLTETRFGLLGHQLFDPTTAWDDYSIGLF
jgi:hypothetical protein